MTQHDSLTALCESVRRAVPDDAAFDLVVIRLMLRTGVNLRSPDHRHVSNPRTIARVSEALAALGLAI
jgi:hypothetical protein